MVSSSTITVSTAMASETGTVAAEDLADVVLVDEVSEAALGRTIPRTAWACRIRIAQ